MPEKLILRHGLKKTYNLSQESFSHPAQMRVQEMNWMTYHIGEEFLIALICLIIAIRALKSSKSEQLTEEIKSRLFLIGSAFILLSINSTVHSSIHVNKLDENLLYQTLLGYCLGLLTLIVAVSSEKPWNKKALPLLYIPLLLLTHPDVYTAFPIFGEFRPLVWIFIAYFSGVVCMLYIAAYYRTRAGRYLFSSLGHALICTSSIMLFFPAPIGSNPWIYGHLLRPMGFTTLFFSMRRKDLTKLTGSILYKALTAFSMLAAIPLLVYGSIVFYENIHPIDFVGRNFMVFVLLLVTLISALIFGLGMIIRLIRPILRLKDSVSGLVEKGLNEKIEVTTNDEIGELSNAYNDMIVKLQQSISERDRLGRLAATGELSATLAHEIKNPLNAISVASAYIAKNYRGNLIKEFIKVIQNEALRINQLTTKLLNFAKPVKAEPVPSDINKLVQETALLLKEESREQNVEVEIDMEKDVPVFNFDYHQIKQILLNLIINSLDAIEKDGRIKIQTRSSDGNVFLSVEDNGKGISDEDMKNIFNPFFTTKTRGTGLGLAISKKIAKEHGGDLLVKSTPSTGSKFTLLLPIRK
jgi:signal transduction histidine kinase